MNILIKNADFSAVSIGQAGTVERKSLLTNVYLMKSAGDYNREAGIEYSENSLKILCYDVSALEGKSVKITGRVSSFNPPFARFYSADAILQDTSYTLDDMKTLNNYFGLPLLTLSGKQTGTETAIVDVPVDAKSLCIYAASNYVDECSLVELV